MTRREFGVGMAMAAVSMRAGAAMGTLRVGVITDEISQDLDHACQVAAKEWGLRRVELREIWGKNLQAATDAELAEAQRVLARYRLRVTDIASPLFKVDWPGAPASPYGAAAGAAKGDLHGAAETTLAQQDEVLARSIALAKRFGTDKVRCFDFWRLDDVAPYRAAMDAKLTEAAETAAKQGVRLVLENEFACNTATGREAAATLRRVPARNLWLNWDPANAVMRGELDAFPAGWELLPKERIAHCHVKNAVKNAAGKIEWSAVNVGYVDWAAQFRALVRNRFRGTASLETHWKDGKSPESASRASWAGMVEELKKAGVGWS